MRSRINRWYKDLQAIEEQIEAREPNADLDSKLAELDRLEANVGRLSVPLAYANPLYTLRSHIALLRDELRQGRRGTTKEETQNFGNKSPIDLGSSVERRRA